MKTPSRLVGRSIDPLVEVVVSARNEAVGPTTSQMLSSRRPNTSVLPSEVM